MLSTKHSLLRLKDYENLLDLCRIYLQRDNFNQPLGFKRMFFGQNCFYRQFNHCVLKNPNPCWEPQDLKSVGPLETAHSASSLGPSLLWPHWHLDHWKPSLWAPLWAPKLWTCSVWESLPFSCSVIACLAQGSYAGTAAIQAVSSVMSGS